MPLVFIMHFAIGLNEEWTNKELKKKFQYSLLLTKPSLRNQKTRSFRVPAHSLKVSRTQYRGLK